jgi:hypothetical protein
VRAALLQGRVVQDVLHTLCYKVLMLQ